MRHERAIVTAIPRELGEAGARLRYQVEKAVPGVRCEPVEVGEDSDAGQLRVERLERREVGLVLGAVSGADLHAVREREENGDVWRRPPSDARSEAPLTEARNQRIRSDRNEQARAPVVRGNGRHRQRKAFLMRPKRPPSPSSSR